MSVPAWYSYCSKLSVFRCAAGHSAASRRGVSVCPLRDCGLGHSLPQPWADSGLTTFAFSLQMADAMEMMILSILAPQLHCEWRLPSWQVALLTSVGSPAALFWRAHTVRTSPRGVLWGCLPLFLLPRAQQERMKPWLEIMQPPHGAPQPGVPDLLHSCWEVGMHLLINLITSPDSKMETPARA